MTQETRRPFNPYDQSFFGLDPDDAAERAEARRQQRGFREQELCEYGVPEALAALPVIRVGRRRKDWMMRDCLLAARFRDHRPRWLHDWARRPPLWLPPLVAHLPAPDRAAAQQVLALHAAHQLQLVQADALLARDHPDAHRRLRPFLERLRACPPTSLRLAVAARPCRHPRLCPWCWGEAVARLWKRLDAGPLADRRGRALFVMRLYLADSRIRLAGDADNSGAIVPGISDRVHLLSAARAKAMRKLAGACLRGFARDMGARGGLLTFQVSSHRNLPDEVSYLHVASLVADVPYATAQERAAARRRDGLEVHTASGDPIPWYLLPADHPLALRLALAGSSTSYPVDRLPLVASPCARELLLREGVTGAFSWEPTFLFNPAQWLFWLGTTIRVPVYSPFGTWRDGIAQARREFEEARRRERRRRERAESPPVQWVRRRARHLRRQALRRVNEAKRQAAAAWQGRLLEAAAALGLAPGQVPGRVQLRRRLAEQGVAATEWQLRWLARRLRAVPGPD